ncbi:MAG: UDP-2,3-diacylglucosamine diphosphatase [Nevskiaceae bacterium]|nr:MAG: UDP-2,3-diacylglucosamine diphosphatase [Nevskiaceae bacterium]
MSVLLLSDLHLPAQPSRLRDVFVEFLEGPARSAKQVFILGDLFEYWIGDDVGLQVYARELSRLAALSAKGVAVAFMRGNRDFLVGDAFAQITGATLLEDPTRLTLAGVPTLLSHGDLYCTDDLAYQRWRRISRNPLCQAVFRALPRGWRERIAGNLRSQSASGKAMKPAGIMDVNEGAIARAFAQHGVTRIIHGHTHRPADHRYDGGGRERIVLADWRPDRMEYLQADDDGLRRVQLV